MRGPLVRGFTVLHLPGSARWLITLRANASGSVFYWVLFIMLLIWIRALAMTRFFSMLFSLNISAYLMLSAFLFSLWLSCIMCSWVSSVSLQNLHLWFAWSFLWFILTSIMLALALSIAWLSFSYKFLCVFWSSCADGGCQVAPVFYFFLHFPPYCFFPLLLGSLFDYFLLVRLSSAWGATSVGDIVPLFSSSICFHLTCCPLFGIFLFFLYSSGLHSCLFHALWVWILFILGILWLVFPEGGSLAFLVLWWISFQFVLLPFWSGPIILSYMSVLGWLLILYIAIRLSFSFPWILCHLFQIVISVWLL